MDRLKNLLLKLKILFPRGIEIYRENKMSVYSGYATLFIVTAVFPCIILIISVVNLIPGYSAKDVADVLLQILPPKMSAMNSLRSTTPALSPGCMRIWRRAACSPF